MKKTFWKPALVIFLLAFGVGFAVRFFVFQPVKRFTKTGDFFGSYVKVDVCYQDRDQERLSAAIDEVWARFADIHKRLSVYDPASDINRINAAYDEPVVVPADTYQLIKDAVGDNKLSGGVYDITLGPLIQLWKAKGKEGRMPASSEIAAARALVDMGAIELSGGNRIRLKRRGVKVNIDSIGDGFAADEAARILRDHGFRNFLVDASGELYGGGHSCRGGKWQIGITDPADTAKLIDVVEISNQAVSTSGSYERFYEIDGRRWSHIIDPRSGYPAEGVTSATVIAPSARFADFLSTAFCVLSPEESFAVIDPRGPAYAAMVVVQDPSGEIKKVSRTYPEFLKKK